MDSAHSYHHLLHFPVCDNAADCLEHGEGWLREKGSAHPDRKLVRVLRAADQLLSLRAAFKALQQARSAGESEGVMSIEMRSH